MAPSCTLATKFMQSACVSGGGHSGARNRGLRVLRGPWRAHYFEAPVPRAALRGRSTRDLPTSGTRVRLQCGRDVARRPPRHRAPEQSRSLCPANHPCTDARLSLCRTRRMQSESESWAPANSYCSPPGGGGGQMVMRCRKSPKGEHCVRRTCQCSFAGHTGRDPLHTVHRWFLYGAWTVTRLFFTA